MTTKEITLPVTGMTCAMCVKNVERSFKRADGVDSVSVNLATERATVQYDASVISTSDMIECLEKSGYGVAKANIDLPITGMTCAMCEKNVARALNRSEGVIQATVNLASEKASVSYLPGVTDRHELTHAVERAGYGVIDTSDRHDGHEDHEAAARQAEIDRQARLVKIGAALHHPADHPQHGAPLFAPGPFPDGQLRLPGGRHLALHLRRAGHARHAAAGEAIRQRRQSNPCATERPTWMC